MDEQNNTTRNHDWWDDLSVEQQQHLNEGLSDAENGRVHSSEAFWEMILNA